jgi:hypothetical protein
VNNNAVAEEARVDGPAWRKVRRLIGRTELLDMKKASTLEGERSRLLADFQDAGHGSRALQH